MTAPILLTGGTGTLGRQVLPLLRAAGHDVRVLSRQPHDDTDGVRYLVGDLRSGRGVDAAVAGVRTVVHLAGGQKGDEEATRTLSRAAARAGAEHLVQISVVGADRVPLAWFRMKAAAEQEVSGSGVPWTVLRAAQFHDLTLTVVRKLATMPVVPVPGGLRFEPVDSGEVARRVAELALGCPAGLVRDLAGPQVLGLGDLVAGYLRAAGKRRPRLGVRMPGQAGRAYRAGENLAGPDADRGTRTWADFLEARMAAPVAART